ncbi:MAG: response regulator [Chloroflexi bacterium]|nr:response regulator [Chloroflexota bacterium]
MSPSPAAQRVLIVDEDPDVLDLLSRQVLEPLGYEVATANDAGTAIQQAVSFSPDLIVASLLLPGLSGKDLLVALRSQGLDVPVLVTAGEGQEADAIQAFRLGAKDYLVKPLREAEVLAAIERALKEVRLTHEANQLAAELAESHRQLEKRVRELTTIYDIGKTVTSTTNQRELFDKLMLSSLNVTNADMGWVLLLDEDSGHLYLRAQRGMPQVLANKLHQQWDDGVSSLVMLSAETLSIHGDGLEQFKLARFAKAALIVPIKARQEAIGVITVAREKPQPFTEPNQRMLEAVGDYASISLINARLFRALTGRAEQLQEVVDETRTDMRDQVAWVDRVRAELNGLQEQLPELLQSSEHPSQRKRLQVLSSDLETLVQDLDELPRLQPAGSPSPTA